ncbi:hypothetical protein Scep_002564 [Stephania cephalantha]|uniref:Uncharacterized protein n=1 Tax=Stephania cephalantha TaxID=152367 RepID=A0AAP0LBG1_9MAGN
MGMKARETLKYALSKHAKARPEDHNIATPSREVNDRGELGTVKSWMISLIEIMRKLL